MRNKRLIILLSVVGVLVLTIIVCGATFLVRHIEAYNYYEVSSEYDAGVVAASGIKNNSSMFFIDEKKAIERIEKEYPNVGVINIERKFPDRVSINYVVYQNSFQYLKGDKYYQCYSSGKVGGTTSAPVGGCFVVRPMGDVSDKVGSYFQSRDGYDFDLVKRFIDYMYTVPLNDKQIADCINFVDLTKSGYFYIRTRGGCAIEIRDTGSNFNALLNGAWSIYADPNPSLPISKATGIIRAEVVRTDPDNPKYRYAYDENYDQADYIRDYLA